MKNSYAIIFLVSVTLLEGRSRQGHIEYEHMVKDDQESSYRRYPPRIRPHYTITSSQSERVGNIVSPIDWSILICTIPQRESMLKRLYGCLMKQINSLGLQDRIEVLVFEDHEEHSIGFKRNILVQASRGEYINFLDDDDMVHPHYISMIYEKLALKPDCISLTGIQTTDGENPLIFIQSLAYKERFEENGVRYLPPHHTNTMKRSIAAQFVFPHVSSGEDTEWAQQVMRSGLLHTEIVIDEPYYFYYYVTLKKNRPT